MIPYILESALLHMAHVLLEHSKRRTAIFVAIVAAIAIAIFVLG